MMDIVGEVVRAEHRIRPFIRETILEHSLHLSRMNGGDVFLKLENLQHTGSFKTRGAMNKILSLTPAQRANGVVAASTGNHGIAVAYCAETLDVKGTIFVPENASPAKVEAIRRLGAEVRFHGSDCVHSEVRAREYSAARGKTYISPYNDPQVVGGQGTVAVELARRLDRIDVVFIALGGGGLISGIGAYLKTVNPEVVVIGCSPENSCVMVESIRAGRILDLESKPTLSDGTAGGIEQGAITFDLCKKLVDDYIVVTEDEIKKAMVSFMEDHHILIEGAAGVAIAAFQRSRKQQENKNVVIVLCGANISLSTLREVLDTS